MTLPAHKQSLLTDLVNELKVIDGVKAIVLGGSYATGMATDSSDLDIGLYYSPANPFDIKDILRVAEAFTDNEQPTVTGFYEWGPWVNGGAWLKTKSGKVDLLYKNIDQVRATIEKAKNGVWENDFDQQPPYGFSSIIFLAETHYCLPLYDPESIVVMLKEQVKQYPLTLKQSVVQQSLWAAEFTIWQAEGFAQKGDTYTTVGCLTRAVKAIVTTLYSLNERYPMGDKRAIDILNQLAIKPKNLAERVDAILCTQKDKLSEPVAQLKNLFNETVSLAQGAYKPYYRL